METRGGLPPSQTQSIIIVPLHGARDREGQVSMLVLVCVQNLWGENRLIGNPRFARPLDWARTFSGAIRTNR